MNHALESVRGLTLLLRTDPAVPLQHLRRLVGQQGVDPAISALVDWCPESSPMDGEGTWELHHLVVVTPDRRAFVGMLCIEHPSVASLAWQEVRAEPIDGAVALIEQLSRNRRAGLPWDDGMPHWVESPKDLIYHELIAAGFEVLAEERSTG